jgi:hypothetical protein
MAPDDHQLMNLISQIREAFFRSPREFQEPVEGESFIRELI